MTGSRQAWEEVLASDPLHRGALTHLAAVSAAEGRFDELEVLVARLSALDDTPGLPAHIHALHTSVRGGEQEWGELLDRLRGEPVRIVGQALSYVTLYLHDLEGGSAIAQILVEPARGSSERTEGHLWLGHLNLAAGRLARAEDEFEFARRLEPERAALHRGMSAVLPRVPVELWALAGAGDPRWTEDPPGVPPVVDAAPRLAPDFGRDVSVAPSSGGPVPEFHIYFEALLSASTSGSPQALNEAAARLDVWSEEDPGSRSLAMGLRATADLLENDAEAAADRLFQAMDEVGFWYERIRQSPLHSLARERFLLAELLVRRGELDEAIRWYRSLVRSSLGELAYLAPARFRLAELHEALGDVAEARRYYEEFLRLWESADPELDPVVAEARARVAHPEALAHSGNRRPN